MTGTRAALAFVLVAIVFLALGVHASSVRGPWGPDEERQVELARELREGASAKRLVVPTRNGEPYPGEPPLAPWTAAAASLVARSELTPFTARLPSLVFSLATLVATYFLGLRLVGADGALRAVLALVSTLGFLAQATTAGVDAMLAAFEAVGITLLFLGAFPKTKAEVRATPDIASAPTLARSVRRKLAASGLFVLVLGTLAGGPETIIVPLVVLGVFSAIGRVRPRLGVAWLGLVAGFVPIAAWLGIAAAVGGLDFARASLLENAARFTAPYGGPPTSVARFVLEGWVALLPLSPLLLAVIWDALRAEWNAQRFGAAPVDRLPTLVPLAWAFATFAIFVASPSRRLSDVVPAFPAVALLASWYYDRPAGAQSSVAFFLEKLGAIGLVAVAVAVVPLHEFTKRRLGLGGGVAWELVPVCVLLAGAGVMGLRRSRSFVPLLALAGLGAFGAVHLRVVPELDRVISSRAGTEELLAAVPGGAELGVSLDEGEEPPDGFVFFARRTFPVVRRADARAWLAGAEKRMLVARVGVDGAEEAARARVGGEELLLLRRK